MYDLFIEVFLAEAKFMGLPIVGLEVKKLEHGVYGLTATYKDGTKATANRRAEIFDGDGYVARKELMANFINIKPNTQRAILEAQEVIGDDRELEDFGDVIEEAGDLPTYNEMRTILKDLGVKPESQSKKDVEAAYKAL